MLKKRDVKKDRKDKDKANKLSAEDKQIVKQAKNKKRAQRREDNKEEDDFDVLFKQHKQALLSKLNQKQKGHAFEEIEMSD